MDNLTRLGKAADGFKGYTVCEVRMILLQFTHFFLGLSFSPFSDGAAL
jgi:hypothetical protein